MTDHIARQVYHEQSVHDEKFPEAVWNFGMENLTEKIRNFNSSVWNEKKSKGMSLKDTIKLEIPAELKIFEKDLKAMHNLE